MTEMASVMAVVSLVLYAMSARRQSERRGRAATVALLAAALLLLVTLVLRGIISRHWPLSSQYEFTLGFALIVSTVYLFSERRYRDRSGGAGVVWLVLALLARALLMTPQARAMGPLPPILRSVWLQAHVLTVMVGYGCFGVAAGFGLAALREQRASPVRSSMARRLVEIGFPWLTLGILTGAMWAQRAWGRYWGWDPKETWSLITWLWYLGTLHMSRRINGQRKRLIWCVLFGFSLVLFTFIGVPALARWQSLDTLHGY